MVLTGAGIPRTPGVGLHTLLHTFAWWLVMAGVDLFTIQELMGHKDIKTNMIYAHLARGHLKDAVMNLDRQHPRSRPQLRLVKGHGHHMGTTAEMAS